MVSIDQDLCSEHTGQEQRPMEAGAHALQVASSECRGEYKKKDKHRWYFL